MKDIKSTYFHVMSVSRMQEVEDEWGKTIQTYAPVPLLQLLPCGFSQASRNSKNTKRTETENVIKYNPKVFCDTNLDIKAGDRITVTFNDKQLGEFTASDPYYYSTHQEIPLEFIGEA